jgi:hypothetical protein
METAITEISMADLKEMSDQQVLERLAYLQELEEQIKGEVIRCRDRLGMIPKRTVPERCEYPGCGSKDLEARAKGGYFCRKCGYRTTG